MDIINLTKENFESEVKKSERPVLIDFWATWCGPCQMLSPIIHEIAEERDDIKVCKVNVDEQMQLASMFNIQSIPALFVIKENTVTAQAVGYRSKEEVLALLEK